METPRNNSMHPQQNEGVYIASLDIGTTKIAAMIARRDAAGKIEIVGFGRSDSFGVRRGVVANIDDTVNAIKNAIGEAEKQAGRKIKYVHVGIAGHHIKSLQHRGNIIRKNGDEEISANDIDRLINDMYNLTVSPGEEIIDVIPQEYTVDGEPGIKNPVGMLGTHLEANFHIIVGQTAAAKNIYKCVRRAGLEVVDLILEPLASAEATLSDEEKEAGIVLVDIGGGTTDIAIFQDNIIRHTAVIPLGGEVITEDVKDGCSIIKKFAEEVKVKYGSALASENSDSDVVSIPGLRGRQSKEITLRNLASIIQARMEEIIEYVYREIQATGLEKKLIGGIVLTGGGAMLKHLSLLTEYMTGMETRIGYPNEHCAATTPKHLSSPMYSTGIGLLLLGFKRMDKDLKRREILQVGQPVSEENAEPVISSAPSNPGSQTPPDNAKNEPVQNPEPAPVPGKRRKSFLERMQDWFNDNDENY
ncbi:MAG: cell division protein FtsA [Bacteroidales bacterium]|nr:cell division protein FtsA [Bacteroidales bacterium]MDN5328973.1 cell division protein FtsA [Bacteroidales bacterium]